MPVLRSLRWFKRVELSSLAYSTVRRAVASLCICALLAPGGAIAQNAQGSTPETAQAIATPEAPAPSSQPTYVAPLQEQTRPYSWIELWKPYAPHTLPEPVLKNSDRLHSLIQDGKLMLSLNDAVALVLENNFDIAIARYNLDIANTDLLLAKAGGTVRGVNTGLVSGTPGGNAASPSTAGVTGTSAGGTTPGIGGVASVGGTVVSTLNTVGPAIDPRDPTLTGTVQADRNLQPVTNAFIVGGVTVPALSQATNTYNFSFNQGFKTGGLLTVAYNNQLLAIPPSVFDASKGLLFNPEITGSWKASFRQHLLQGFGVAVNNRQIYIAKNDVKVTDASFRAQVIASVAQIQNIYWDLVNAYENVKVQQTALEFAQQTLKNNQLQVKVGTLAPIEVVSAQSSVATAQQNLITAQTNLQYQQLIMKNAIARNFNDPALTAATVIPTDTMELSNEPMPPAEDLVAYALANRPELLESELNLRNGEINMKAARSALLPTLDAVGYYGSAGANDNAFSVFSNLVNRNFPDYGGYLSLNVTIRNRQAQANQIRSELEYRQNQLLFQQQKNQINLQVRNAAYALQQARAGVDSARAARDYAQQNLEAEQKKFALGASTSYLVLQQQANETQSASNYVAALSTYEKARVALEQVTAQILDRNGISMEEAVRGQVIHEPSIPGLVPNATPGTVSAPPAPR